MYYCFKLLHHGKWPVATEWLILHKKPQFPWLFLKHVALNCLFLLFCLVAAFFFVFLYILYSVFWKPVLYFSPCVFQWLYNMQDTDARGSSPAFLRPQNGNSHRSSGYIPGRIAPLRPPPPLQSHATAEFTSARQEARTRLPSLPVDQPRRQAEANRHKNTLICFAISSLSLFVALGISLGIASKYAPDGKCFLPTRSSYQLIVPMNIIQWFSIRISVKS